MLSTAWTVGLHKTLKLSRAPVHLAGPNPETGALQTLALQCWLFHCNSYTKLRVPDFDNVP